MQRAQVTRHITRESKSPNYTGYIAIMNTILHFTVSFPKGMDWFLEEGSASTSDMREHCILVVTNNGTPVELEDDEFAALFGLIADLAIDFEYEAKEKQRKSFLVAIAKAMGAAVSAMQHEEAVIEADESFFDIFKREKFRN